jgi:predicted O-methyltransferase YrrM
LLDRRSDRRDPRPSLSSYQVLEGIEQTIHAQIGVEWPCAESSEFDGVWSAALAELDARGLRVGRGTFGEWDDGDARLAQIAWCLTRHVRPKRIVETGVGRGLLTRVILEALERNGAGRLWSIDLPPFLVPGAARESAAAVSDDLRHRWALLRGTSRRLLPRLVADYRRIDLFIHDSSHTTRNVRFELEQVWPALAPGGVVLIDDVEKNAATAHFLEAHLDAQGWISRSSDRKVLIACLMKPPV